MLVDEIGAYLTGAGLGLTIGTNLFLVPFPTTAPVDVVVACLSPYGGARSGYTLGANQGNVTPPLFELPYFHVFVRGPIDGDQAAQTLARQIYAKLDGVSGITMGGVFYEDIRSKSGPPKRLGQAFDPNQQPIWFMDFEVMKDVSPS